MTVPEWWSEGLRDRVASEVAACLLHLGSHAPPLDEFAQPMMGPNGTIFFRCGDDVFAHKSAMAFWWRFKDDGSVAV